MPWTWLKSSGSFSVPVALVEGMQRATRKNELPKLLKSYGILLISICLKILSWSCETG